MRGSCHTACPVGCWDYLSYLEKQIVCLGSIFLKILPPSSSPQHLRPLLSISSIFSSASTPSSPQHLLRPLLSISSILSLLQSLVSSASWGVSSACLPALLLNSRFYLVILISKCSPSLSLFLLRALPVVSQISYLILKKILNFFLVPALSLFSCFFFFPFLSFSYESWYVLSLHFVEFPDCVRAVEITYRNNLTSGLQGTETGEELDILLGCSEPQAPIEHFWDQRLS